ncbi:hypothetical protein A0H81_10574 [Grifola frondosa]|uniref:Uncharacterized protein n=1 Tax=Grifola frondosa TaxID=5627 RepID=A0A1C7LXP4_GRIFR|nr:hypothetical protein A0H81_10574 [Grifola frondosa]
MEIGGTTKTFSHEETRRPVTHKIEIPVEAGQTTYFYQRKYKLKTRVWFMLDAWGQAWVVGRYTISEPWTRTVLTEVMSNEFVRRSRRLEGEGEIPPARVPEFRKVARSMSIKNVGYDRLQNSSFASHTKVSVNAEITSRAPSTCPRHLNFDLVSHKGVIVM